MRGKQILAYHQRIIKPPFKETLIKCGGAFRLKGRMVIQVLADKIITEAKSKAGKRYMIAIAGPPASGKSTFAEKLSLKINQQSRESICEVIPMDGFHLDNTTLVKLQLRHRKGAENTFDSTGFTKMIKALHISNEAISIPLFDRAKDATVPDAKTISPAIQILIIEGNYLLLNTEPWTQVQGNYDYKIFLNPDIDTVKKRLIDRWLENGYNLEDAKQRALSNDIPNAEYVLEHSVGADLVISNNKSIDSSTTNSD